MAQKDEMSPRALEMEELENVNGGNGGSSPLPGEGLPTGGKPVRDGGGIHRFFFD